MSFELLGDLNWLAVILAAAAYFVLGAIWYARPVLGTVWMEAGGMQMPAEGERPGPAIFAVPAVGSLLSAIAMVTATFESNKPKPMVWGAVNAGYHLVGNLVAAILIAAIQ